MTTVRTKQSEGHVARGALSDVQLAPYIVGQS